MFFFSYFILFELGFFYFFPAFFFEGSVYFLFYRLILILFSSAYFFYIYPIKLVGDLLLLIIADLLLLPSPYPLRYCTFNRFCVWLNCESELPDGEDSTDLFFADVLFLPLYFLGLDFFYSRLLDLFDWCFASSTLDTIILLFFFVFLAERGYTAFNGYFYSVSKAASSSSSK